MSNDPGQLDLTHWVYRLIAYIIDSIIVGIPAAIIYWVILVGLITPSATYFGVTIYGATPLWGGLVLLPFVIGILQLLYFMILDVAWGGTVGKRVLGLQVQTESGGRIDIGKAFIRNISKIYGVFLFLDWLVAVITAGKDKRQKFTDRMAGTTVAQIKAAFGTAPPPPPPPPPPPE